RLLRGTGHGLDAAGRHRNLVPRPGFRRHLLPAESPAAGRHLRHGQEIAMSTIDIRKATKKFGSFVAVRDVDLSVAAGEVVCLLGPSGCGKTTTLRMIAGLERATAGDIVIAGRRMNELPPE